MPNRHDMMQTKPQDDAYHDSRMRLLFYATMFFGMAILFAIQERMMMAFASLILSVLLMAHSQLKPLRVSQAMMLAFLYGFVGFVFYNAGPPEWILAFAPGATALLMLAHAALGVLARKRGRPV